MDKAAVPNLTDGSFRHSLDEPDKLEDKKEMSAIDHVRRNSQINEKRKMRIE